MANNFNLALRRLSRDKTFTILNLAGLVIGIAAALQVYFIVSYELSIDRWHSKADRIYRVVSTETYRNGLISYDGCAPIPLAEGLRKESGIVQHIRFSLAGGRPVDRSCQTEYGSPYPQHCQRLVRRLETSYGEDHTRR